MGKDPGRRNHDGHESGEVGEQDGKQIWENQKTAVPNRELKARVEAYKSRNRESARGKLDSLARETAAKHSPEGRKAKPKDSGPEH